MPKKERLNEHSTNLLFARQNFYFWTVSVFKNTNWGNGLRILVALMAQNIQSGPAAVSVYGECIQTPRFARLTFTESACGADSPPHLSSTPRLHAPLFMNENINSPSAEVSPRKKHTGVSHHYKFIWVVSLSDRGSVHPANTADR